MLLVIVVGFCGLFLGILVLILLIKLLFMLVFLVKILLFRCVKIDIREVFSFNVIIVLMILCFVILSLVGFVRIKKYFVIESRVNLVINIFVIVLDLNEILRFWVKFLDVVWVVWMLVCMEISMLIYFVVLERIVLIKNLNVVSLLSNIYKMMKIIVFIMLIVVYWWFK